MRAVVQRVSRAEVRVGREIVGRIGRGLLVLIAVEKGDSTSDLDWLSDKVLHMRVFEDGHGKMNLSALETRSEILVVSQFTLAGDLNRGRRPGFERAAPPEEAEPLYVAFVERLSRSPLNIQTGRFREFMDVELVNDGPVTLILEGRPR
ncbi:MAG: D-tyrosyl-tRNA(Tyr) deacylase [Acidobacteria bacterium 13_1_20CM_2_68_14]|nr:MAG: D-tyrosyl-tRNA(Tyr) deacylase [Acidobacteria bacterium 13_1_20CM_2_68_14]